MLAAWTRRRVPKVMDTNIFAKRAARSFRIEKLRTSGYFETSLPIKQTALHSGKFFRVLTLLKILIGAIPFCI
jgi:hypothetical protein